MEKLSVKKGGTLAEFQEFIGLVYAVPDDRLYSLWDLLVQEQRFAMRALKGIRKHDIEKVKLNLLVSLSWLMSIANRLHVDIDAEAWRRFPGRCSYCGEKPCACSTIKPDQRKNISGNLSAKPKSINDVQEMFRAIYPPETRTLADAGVHLAEEVGEVSEAIHNYLGEHKAEQFDEVSLEMADFISCIFGVANSAGIDVEAELSAMFSENCHVCHSAPCVCTFTAVATLKS